MGTLVLHWGSNLKFIRKNCREIWNAFEDDEINEELRKVFDVYNNITCGPTEKSCYALFPDQQL